MTEFNKLYWCEQADHPDWDLWDDFLQETPRGHYLQLSDWLKAYSVYGFKAILLLGKTLEGQIYGGLGVVIAGLSFIKLHIAPAGPIIREGWEAHTESFLKEFYCYSKRSGAAYAHINVPILQEGEMPFSLPQGVLMSSSIFYSGKEGIRFKNVATISGLRWVDMTSYTYETTDKLLESLPSKTRRDIRTSQRKNLQCKVCLRHSMVKKAYHAIEQAAKENRYAVREWEDVSALISSTFKKGYSSFIVATKDEELKGAIWLIKCGKRFTYMSGGAKRETPDLLAGYLLQWNALTQSLEEDFQGYDISVGGSPGVLKFKNNFNPVYYSFVEPRYWIFSKWKFFLFDFFYKKLAKHKKMVASILKGFSR